MISWDLAASKVALSFDADPETKAEEVTVSATTVRLEEGMSLIPDAEEDSRRIERHKLVSRVLSSPLPEAGSNNMTLTQATASHMRALMSCIP